LGAVLFLMLPVAPSLCLSLVALPLYQLALYEPETSLRQRGTVLSSLYDG
jgi:hypothetical protein